MTNAERTACQWIISDDTGSSSKQIWSVMMGVAGVQAWEAYPSDTADLGRCIRLLECIPEWKARMAEMAMRGYRWAALVKHWDELTTKYEIASAKPNGKRSAYFEVLHDRMREILSGAVKP